MWGGYVQTRRRLDAGDARRMSIVVSPPSPPPPADSAESLLDWLARKYPSAKRQTLRRMLQAGRVRLNGKVVKRAGESVRPDDRIDVSDEAPPPGRGRENDAAAKQRRLEIVYEDGDLLVVDKPAGLLTSTVPRERRPTLLATVRAHVAQADGKDAARVGLIHRLDRDASGLLVFSKNHEAYRSLKQQFFDHTVERVYTAVVEGVPNPRSARVESRLVERADGTVYSTRRPDEGEHALTEYEVTAEAGGRSVVRVKLHTGRKHQIRVHLSERGTPIVGDTVYGRDPRAASGPRAAKREPAAGRLLLMATMLSFTHPRTGERLTFDLPPPKWAAAGVR